MGPRTETDPWGKPQVTVWRFEVEWPMEMYSVRFVTYEWNQLRAVSVSPVVRWSRFNKMAWSTVGLQRIKKTHGSDRFADQSHGSDHFSDQQKKTQKNINLVFWFINTFKLLN